mmetsp:Transcript_49937/g.109074  ORF Transcript_49937/g.109074 Transcript_49937/m.109074 type:complete len:524 (-) Transcript_49937:79-1650(-)|eukprot:CAMPEP_0204270366 /NCGR_PEP_ID=MMETSP0468-20130131/18854_1 /ASSEMBLY_ACC=CAM_ASM_000383 /TAXON_ID=2969 /ORGANISM="Oxyrrhis marina" /LENGTH=523 /DNA_ID=CAMNT_0051245891 /DNA_START=60 /DNA_END=1631 /DNA_ORIENTATION=-
MKIGVSALLVSTVVADLPVHCLRHQVAGQWTFHLSTASATRSRCGHLSPDRSSEQPSINMAEYPTTVSVNLDAPNSASVGSDSGTWTMIYDEGFDITTGSKKFMAFNMFDQSIQADGNVESYKSDCARTQVGWFHDTALDQWGCFIGVKSGGGADTPAPVAPAAPKMDDVFSSSTDFAPKRSTESALDEMLSSLQRHDAFLQMQNRVVPAEEHHQRVDKINSNQKGWTAKVYPHLLNKTQGELNAFAGIRRAGVKSVADTRKASFLQTGTEVQRAKQRMESMPKDFDWRNKDGKNYVPHPINQGSCGSCYTVSAMTMLSARNRIVEDNPDAEPFSMQVPLFCSEYNQGCDGGYPELIAKWGQDVGLVPESCGRYNLHEKTCSLACDASSAATHKVADYGYVGGFYGAGREAEMMEEIYNRGPIAVAIEPADDFMYYSKGVYEHTSAVFTEWAKVDHAVLVTGWGEEEGKPYWRVQNSWGRNWGEDGTIRMRKGADESAVEAQPIFATVEKSSDSSRFGIYGGL